MRFSRVFPAVRLVAVVLASSLWIASAAAAEKGASYQAALESITAPDLGGHIAHLADKALEGREAGKPGGLAAGKYLVGLYSGWHLEPAGENGDYLQPFGPDFHNILAMLPGSDPELRDQVILVGAHYDHVGYGGRGFSLGPSGYIHPGADDNASGTSAVLKLAQAFTLLSQPPKRSLLFVAWDAEEKGMLGSKHWCAHPTIPLKRVVAAMNLDMIGRLRHDRVTVFGSRTGYGWRRLVCSQNDDLGLNFDFRWLMKPNADHFPLFSSGIPVLMFHTGVHANYHRPSDTADRINNAGVMRVTRLAFRVLYDLADRNAPAPAFRSAARHETEEMKQAAAAETAAPEERLGVGWVDDAAQTGGVRISQITPGSPAEKAGLQVGDTITRFAGREIHCDNDFYAAVSSAASPAAVTVQRAASSKPVEAVVALQGTPLRWGIYWRVDDAEPGEIILTHVAPGTPAALAGLQVGDRIFQIDGRDFADETAFVKWTQRDVTRVPLTIERQGQPHAVMLQLQQPAPQKRAA